MSRDNEGLAVGEVCQLLSSTNAHSRGVQHVSRLSSITDASRVVSESVNGRQSSTNGVSRLSFCIPFQQQMQQAVCLDPPSATVTQGHTSPCLAFQSSVRLSSSTSDSQVFTESFQVAERSDSHCFLLAMTNPIHLPLLSSCLPSDEVGSVPRSFLTHQGIPIGTYRA